MGDPLSKVDRKLNKFHQLPLFFFKNCRLVIVKKFIILTFLITLQGCGDEISYSVFKKTLGSSATNEEAEIVYTYISSAADPDKISQNLGNYALTQNIDLGGVIWEPIGTFDEPFTGIFNGQHFKISNLSYTGDTYQHLGIFASTGEDSAIINVQLENIFFWNTNSMTCTTEDSCSTGALIGFFSCQLMVELTGISTLKGNQNIGGLVGVQVSGYLRKVSVTDGVIEEDGGGFTNIGGIVGHLRGLGTFMNNCYFKGNVEGENTENVGGIAGKLTGSLSYCYFVGDVDGG